MLVYDSQIRAKAGDATTSVCGHNTESIIKKLESDAVKLATWFPNNCIQFNEKNAM